MSFVNWRVTVKDNDYKVIHDWIYDHRGAAKEAMDLYLSLDRDDVMSVTLRSELVTPFISTREKAYPDFSGIDILVWTKHGNYAKAVYKWNKKLARYSWFWDGKFRKDEEVESWAYLDTRPEVIIKYHPKSEYYEKFKDYYPNSKVKSSKPPLFF